ncbi:MAG: hypothetical protein HZC45_02140 [Deltaproteobacteria bacterium]|nr:hypothetical protein [Deltaproteobacteria bacterium]
MGLRKAKFRGAKFIREQIPLTAASQNIKKIVRLLSWRGPQKEALAAGKPLILFSISGLLKIFFYLYQNIRRKQFNKRDCSANCFAND